MASIRVKYRPSAATSREGAVYYQVIHERKVRQVVTDYRIQPDEWDERRSMVKSQDNEERGPLILAIGRLIRRDVERLTTIAKRLDDKGLPYSADDVIDRFHRDRRDCSLSRFMGGLISRFRNIGKTRTSETYTAALNSFRKFLADHEAPYRAASLGIDITLDCVTTDIMEAYEAWHRRRGNTPNTISFYTRILRAAYNRAVEEGIIENRHPFRHVYTGIGKTVKRAMPLSHVSRIKSLDLSHSPRLDYARDMFMMSFYLRGMSFIDMTFLKKTDLSGGHITYRRRKTGQRLVIAWTPEMQAILDKYPRNPTSYLLPIIKSAGINERCAYRNTGYTINQSLKKVAALAGISIPLTMYVARHSWASAAQAKGIPVSVISEGMGHDSESTTRIYLASLDTSVVDRANSLILSSL